MKSIMKEDYEDILGSEGTMRVLREVPNLETGESIDVVIRSITEDFWKKVIETTKTHRVCALGTPGIGKSTSTCILIRHLLKQQKIVVYHVRTIDKVGFVYMFTPTLEESVDVKVVREKDFNILDENINQPSTYYISDPGQTEGNCNAPVDFLGKVIIITSVNNGHWGGSDFLKQRGPTKGLFMFLPVWNLTELILAKDCFDYKISDNVIIDRYEHVGGIPRHIFTDEVTYSQVLQSQKAAINNLTEEQLRKMAHGDIDSVHTFDKSQPKSMILAFVSSNDKNFRSVSVAISSKSVLSSLITKYETSMWSLIAGQDNDKRGSFRWKLFETYCQNKMKGRQQEYFDYQCYDGTRLVTVSDRSLLLGGCTKIQGTREDLISAAKREECVLFYPLDSYYKFIDFIYRVGSMYYAFQVTISATHSCNTTHLKELATSAGGESMLRLHYLTPAFKDSEFVFKPTKPGIEFSSNNGWTINVVYIPSPVENHKGPRKSNTTAPTNVLPSEIKEKCQRIGVSMQGNEETVVQRLELVDSKEPHNVDVPTKEKLDAFTKNALKILCRRLELSNKGDKGAIIQRLLNYAKINSVKNFASMLPTDVKINYIQPIK